jgi:hypothetical protein
VTFAPKIIVYERGGKKRLFWKQREQNLAGNLSFLDGKKCPKTPNQKPTNPCVDCKVAG